MLISRLVAGYGGMDGFRVGLISEAARVGRCRPGGFVRFAVCCRDVVLLPDGPDTDKGLADHLKDG